MGIGFRMSIAINAHHGFVDGEHIAYFYDTIQMSLNNDSDK